MQKSLRTLLSGGDRRSIGRANEVAQLVLTDESRFRELFKLMWDEDAVVAMRTADAVEKVTCVVPELLRSYKRELLGLLAEASQKELRWHLAAMVARLPLEKAEARRAAEVLREYLDDNSSIVKTFALQALFDLSLKGSIPRDEIIDLLQVVEKTGTAAMRARARKLLSRSRT